MHSVQAINLAAAIAIRRLDRRAYMLGAVGIRRDGAIVHACNGPAEDVRPCAHAEARLARKLDRGATVYVARVRRGGGLAMSRPCPACLRLLASKKVARVVYSMDGGVGEIVL